MADKIAFAPAPIAITPKGSHWLWAWAFAIPKAAKNPEGAQKFSEWASSKDYIKLVAEDAGWATVPPGTRKSTYDNPDYQKAAPFAVVTLKAMQTADPTNPCIKPVPYTARTPHIHFKVKQGGKELLTTQCYIKGYAGNERDMIWRGIRREPATAVGTLPFTRVPPRDTGPCRPA